MAPRRKTAPSLPALPQGLPEVNGPMKTMKGHIAFNINPALKSWLDMYCRAEGMTQGEAIERILVERARTYDMSAKLAELQRQLTAAF